jgi:hypothetical protein
MSKRKRHIFTLEDAKPRLGPIVPTLLDSFWEAWEWTQGWIDANDKARMILNTSTVAGIVSDAFGNICRPKLVEDFSAIWKSSGRFHHAVIGQELALRFKKLTPDLHSMNVRTEAQRKVYEQDEALPNAQPITHITLGYTLNAIASKVRGLYFTCPADFDRNHWYWPIYDAGDNQLPLFDGTPLPPIGPVEDVLNVDIKLKRRKAEQA